MRRFGHTRAHSTRVAQGLRRRTRLCGDPGWDPRGWRGRAPPWSPSFSLGLPSQMCGRDAASAGPALPVPSGLPSPATPRTVLAWTGPSKGAAYGTGAPRHPMRRLWAEPVGERTQLAEEHGHPGWECQVKGTGSVPSTPGGGSAPQGNSGWLEKWKRRQAGRRLGMPAPQGERRKHGAGGFEQQARGRRSRKQDPRVTGSAAGGQRVGWRHPGGSCSPTRAQGMGDLVAPTDTATPGEACDACWAACLTSAQKEG